MAWIGRHIAGIMTVSGLLTCTMLYAAVAPQAALVATFGSGLEGPAADVVIRNWGILITLVGVLLVYGARRPEVRPVAIAVACVSKTAFLVLLLVWGRDFLAGPAAVPFVSDVVQVSLLGSYLAARPR